MYFPSCHFYNTNVQFLFQLNKFIFIKILLLSDIYIFIDMSKKPINPEDRKIKLSITINPNLFNIIDKVFQNKSKYIEELIMTDIKHNKKKYE